VRRGIDYGVRIGGDGGGAVRDYAVYVHGFGECEHGELCGGGSDVYAGIVLVAGRDCDFALLGLAEFWDGSDVYG